ncbi:MAG TPA: P1 family peptidase [archaeon]|nr:P1 family peptidase [archaeon]
MKTTNKNDKVTAPPDNSHRRTLREMGLAIGEFQTGKYNAITDVSGIMVGHVTLWYGDGSLVTGQGPVRTGATAVIPHPGNTLLSPVEAGCHVFNGAGTTAGLSLLEEYGQIETPILLTTTLAVGAAYQGLVRYVVENFCQGPDNKAWFNPLVGETDDSYLNDSHGLHLRPEHAVEAIRSARSGPVAEGVVGAGTGIRTCGFKAGIGSASRLVQLDKRTFTVGALVQSNFLGSLTVDGVPVGKDLGVAGDSGGWQSGGSLMTILATDLPLSSRQLKRLAKRGVLGMARVGAAGSHSSGDYFIAFSTTFRQGRNESESPFGLTSILADEFLSPVFAAAREAVEEAILNSIFKAVTVTGRDSHTAYEIDLEKVMEILHSYGKL